MSRLVLVVDDDPIYIDLVKDILATQDVPIVGATNGESALKLLHTNNVALIISDIDMPVMNGFEFHERVRADHRYHSIPFVFFTGSVDPETHARIGKIHGARIIAKGNPVKDLLALVPSIR